MKKNVIWIIVIVCVLAAALIPTLLLSEEPQPTPTKNPFKDLNAADIASATVTLNPPGQTIHIQDTEMLASLLRDVVIGKKDDTWGQSNGQSVRFTLTMTDGTQLEVIAYNPFIAIDGVGYQCEYRPCEALSNYANALLDGVKES